MWRYRVNDSTWTWMGGSDTINDPGVYGEPGVANTTYWPPSFSYVAGWYDSVTRDLWLFGSNGTYQLS